MYKISSSRFSDNIWDTPFPDTVPPVFVTSYILARRAAKDYVKHMKDLAQKDPSILNKNVFEKIKALSPFVMDHIRSGSLIVPAVSLPIGLGLYKLRKNIFKKKKSKLQQLLGG